LAWPRQRPCTITNHWNSAIAMVQSYGWAATTTTFPSAGNTPG